MRIIHSFIHSFRLFCIRNAAREVSSDTERERERKREREREKREFFFQFLRVAKKTATSKTIDSLSFFLSFRRFDASDPRSQRHV